MGAESLSPSEWAAIAHGMTVGWPKLLSGEICGGVIADYLTTLSADELERVHAVFLAAYAMGAGCQVAIDDLRKKERAN